MGESHKKVKVRFNHKTKKKQNNKIYFGLMKIISENWEGVLKCHVKLHKNALVVCLDIFCEIHPKSLAFTLAVFHKANYNFFPQLNVIVPST